MEEPSQISVVILRDGPTDLPVSLKYQTIDGTASNLTGDYEPIVNGLVTFNSGEARKEVLVRALDDSVPEGRESFYVQVYDIIGMNQQFT
jgi:hypothetical protein